MFSSSAALVRRLHSYAAKLAMKKLKKFCLKLKKIERELNLSKVQIEIQCWPGTNLMVYTRSNIQNLGIFLQSFHQCGKKALGLLDVTTFSRMERGSFWLTGSFLNFPQKSIYLEQWYIC